MAIITLTTDFASADAYVGAMKGVILSINPQAIIVDLCHSVAAQNVVEGAFLLGTAFPFFPRDTIHVVVVDPGVGSSRQAVLLTTPSSRFLAPDNGVLSYVLEELLGPMEPAASVDAETLSPYAPRGLTLTPRKLTQDLHAVVLTNAHYWLPTVSTTFHGRDVFAPVAAHLSLGTPPCQFGQPLDRLLAFPIPRPTATEQGLMGQVLHIDGFGNVITNIKESDLLGGPSVFLVAGQRITGLSTAYAAGGSLLALVGSSGYVEVAARNGSAAHRLGVQVGDAVTVLTQG